MARITGIGLQDFEKIRRQNIFLVDKTEFIKEWWENRDDVTLITRPRCFGKTLTISMVENFFRRNIERRIFLKAWISGNMRNTENSRELILKWRLPSGVL